jgi:hypothetical protein
MAMDFSILDALATICNSAPEWNARLDKLNGQITNRQLELARFRAEELTRLREEEIARFTENERPSTRSPENKSSTKPLQPKDGNKNPSISGNLSNADDAQIDPFDSPNLHENGSIASAPRLSSSTTSRKLGIGRMLRPGSRPVSLINRMSAYLSRNFKFHSFSYWNSLPETSFTAPAPSPYIISITNISLDGLSSLRILYPSAWTWCKAVVLPPNDGGHFESATIS